MSNPTPKRRITPTLISPTPNQPYKTKTIPNKGLGLIATRKTPALSTILISERPILRIPSTMDENDDTALTIWLERFLLTMSPDLAAEKRKATFSLVNSHPGKGRLAGILQTNGFELEAGEGWPACRGLFIVVSRINHSCLPNCAQRWDGGKGVMIIVPAREIDVGEEITLTYLENAESMGVVQRRESLMDGFGFWCECELCRAEGGDEMVRKELDGRAAKGDGEAETFPEVKEPDGNGQDERCERKGSPFKERPTWIARW